MRGPPPSRFPGRRKPSRKSVSWLSLPYAEQGFDRVERTLLSAAFDLDVDFDVEFRVPHPCAFQGCGFS